MKKLNKLYLIIACLAYTGTLCSQTLTWQRQPSWDAVEMFGDHLLKVEQSGKWGLADFDGNAVMPCNYACLTEIREGRFLVVDGNHKLLSLCDPEGNVVKEVEGDWYVDDAWPYFTNGMLAVRTPQNLWGYMDKDGKIVIRAKLKNAFPFFFGYASVCENNKKGWHIINTEGDRLAVNGVKNFSFASSFSEIDKHPRAMVLIADKVYFVDAYGNVTNDVVSVEGATVSGFGFGRPCECVDGHSPVAIEVNAVLETTSVRNGDKDYVCQVSSVEALPFPQVREIGIEGEGTIKAGGLAIAPQFQEAVPLASDRLLMKKDGKWGLLKFDLNELALRIVPNESSMQEICHNVMLPFQVMGKRGQMKAYTSDDSGKVSYWDVDPVTGRFYAPMHHLAGKGEAVAVVGLMVDDVLLEPTVLTQKVSLCDGFRATGPAQVIVNKSGKATFELTVWNNSDQDAAPFDVSVDNGTELHFEGLLARQSVTVPVSKYVKIPDLEDYDNKTMKVTVTEKGMPERNYWVTVKFAKPSKKG